MIRSFGVLILLTTALSSVCPVWGEERFRHFRFEAESGPSWQTRNDVAIPGSTGTRFSLSDFSNGPFFAYRLTAWWRFNDHHAVRALFAPFEVSVDGTSASDISFDGSLFAAGTPLHGTYKFNSYRLAYLYTFSAVGPWRFSLGFSAKIRDARVALENASVSQDYTNIGFVPLLAGRVEYHFTPKLWTLLDFEALAAPQGRAEDVTVQLRYRAFDPVDLGVGYRMVEGGADNDKVYTFAWIHYAVFSVAAEF
jgi:hypothetical protein